MAEDLSEVDDQSAPALYRSPDKDLYRLVYDESKRALDDQLDELSGLRQRAVQYSAFVGAATAFLVGAGLKAAVDRGAVFYGLMVPASLLWAVALIALALLLQPGKGWKFRLTAKVLIERWIEREVPHPSEADLLRGLAVRYDKARESNELKLTRLRRVYQVMIISGGVALLLWVLLVWFTG